MGKGWCSTKCVPSHENDVLVEALVNSLTTLIGYYFGMGASRTSAKKRVLMHEELKRLSGAG